MIFSLGRRRSAGGGWMIAGVWLAGTAFAAPAQPDAAAHEAWRARLAAFALPANRCFRAHYPDAAWTRVACTAAPNVTYLPHRGPADTAANTVGNGHDYAAGVTHLITKGVGSFPMVTGVTSERDVLANIYSLQLNSEFFVSPACSGAANPAACLGWQQFVYSSSSRSVFMQYWLINYATTCPAGWNSYSTDCYRNSAAVTAPKIPITQLGTLSITGTAAAGGTDSVVFTTATDAYSTTGPDRVVTLAGGWTQAEYNVIGDGSGSKASFNAGSQIGVKIALTDGDTAAPSCLSNAGTTGETNNLNLGGCRAASGASPSISFLESN